MPNKLKIITQPNPILRKKSVKIDFKNIDAIKFRQLASALLNTMLKADGAGLAAPQIGQNIRLIAINIQNGSFCLINPKITKKSWAKIWDSEGCLSVPGVYGKVRRHKKITCSYLTENGQPKSITAEGLLARVIQHEIDHLDGILFIDKARNIEKQKTE